VGKEIKDADGEEEMGPRGPVARRKRWKWRRE
jgi:hypothetical protein